MKELPKGREAWPTMTSQGSELKTRFSVPLIIFFNGFSHAYILISLMQVRTSPVTRMRLSLTSDVWWCILTIFLFKNTCSQIAARTSLDRAEEFSPAEVGQPGVYPMVKSRCGLSTWVRFYTVWIHCDSINSRALLKIFQWKPLHHALEHLPHTSWGCFSPASQARMWLTKQILLLCLWKL